MRKSLAVVLLALALGGMARPLHAQDAPKCKLFCAPVFVAQPGLVVTNAINKVAGASTETHFLFRFTTVIPTSIPRTALVVLTQWTPENKGSTDFNSNAPAFVYGPVVSLFDAGPVNVSVDALGVFAPSADTTASYQTNLNVEGIVSLGLGHLMKMMGSTPGPYLNGVAINALIDQQLTRLHGTGHHPVLLFLLTLPIAPMP